MQGLRVFESAEFGELGVMELEGRMYFPATQCAKILGYSNPYKAIIDHCLDDGLTKREAINSLGRTQQMKYISEGNLCRLIVGSRLSVARRFERWVFDEVLPSIRKMGDRKSLDPEKLVAQIGSSVINEVLEQLLPALRRFVQRPQSEDQVERRDTMEKPRPQLDQSLCAERIYNYFIVG